MHADGTLPVLELNGTIGELTPPGQSPGTRQTLIAAPPLPRVSLPALLASKATALTLFGTRMAVRVIALNSCSIWFGGISPTTAAAACPDTLPETLQPPVPDTEPARLVTRWRSAPAPSGGTTRTS